MSIVKKMIVQGVRSFHPEDSRAQMIEFQTPLTLIVGINGSGKTTIIEALKYAITNKFPPNCTNGSSFVNDPRLSKNSVATGVVKLEVEDGFGNLVQTTRRIQVSMKEKTQTLTKKELDATIKFCDKDGKRKEISSKCIDTKTEMCRVMGVSEAVLNHVILCHQEDSCWPLDEAKKVKEKFDSIFNTTMYIKCLDHLSKKDKELGQHAKLEAEGLKYVSDNRKIARRKRTDLETKEIELKSVMDQIGVYEKELREVEERLKSLQEMEREHIAVESKVSEVSGKLQMLEKQVSQMKKNIKTEFDGDITMLQHHIQDFDRKHKTHEEKLKTTQRQLQVKEDEFKKLTQQQKSILVEEGKFQQEENANKERLEAVKDHINSIINTIKKLKDGSQNTTFSNSMDSCLELCETAFAEGSSNEAVIKAMSSAIRVREAEILKTKTQYENEEKDIQNKIDKLRSKRASLDKEISMKKQQIEENKTSIEEIRDRLRAIDGSNETLALLSDDEQRCVESIEAIEKSGILDKCGNEIKLLDGEINKLELQITEMGSKVEVLTEDKGICDQISSYNRQKIQKQNECNEIMRRIEDDLKLVLGEIPETNLSQKLEKKREVLAKELNQKRAEQRQKEREWTVTDTELKRTGDDLKDKEKRLDFLKEKVSEVLEEADYDSRFESVTKSLDKKKKEIYYSEAARFLYKKYIQKLNKKDCCPLCKRDLETRQKVQDLINEIESEIEKIQRSEPQEKVDIERLNTTHIQLQDLKPFWDEKNVLENEKIPELKTKKHSLEQKIRELKDELDDIGDTVGVLENDHSIAVKCSKDSALFENVSKDVKKYEDNIAKLEKTRSQKALDLQGELSLSDAKTQLQSTKASQAAKKMEKESKRDMLSKKQTELTRRKDEKNKIKEEILKITADLRDRDGIEGQKKDLEEANKSLQVQISDLMKEVPKAKSDITEEENKKTDCIKRREDCLNLLRSERELLEKQKTKLSDLDKQIQEFEQKRGRIVDIQKRSVECKKKIEDVESHRNELRREIDDINKQLANHKLEKRNLEDNLTLKQNYEHVEKLKAELDEKKKLLEQTKNRGVANERREQALKHQQMSAKMNKDLGQKNQIINQIRDLKNELNEKTLANAEKEYVEKFVRKTVYEKTQQDVRKYRAVLDSAIMTFHAKRMQTINNLLKKYWTEIYKGNDIDSIQIRTDNADTVPGAGQKVKIDTGKATRKVYNYRVVSIRQKHELDMRGRCSAGQRVLASIIIRIALAETFSSRCGVITLDEPTTNLDQRNINSLADALGRLAQRFSARKNFQLIVITHDQEFVERLSQVDVHEKYWKIDRDPQGFSRIFMVKKRGT